MVGYPQSHLPSLHCQPKKIAALQPHAPSEISTHSHKQYTTAEEGSFALFFSPRNLHVWYNDTKWITHLHCLALQETSSLLPKQRALFQVGPGMQSQHNTHLSLCRHDRTLSCTTTHISVCVVMTELCHVPLRDGSELFAVSSHYTLVQSLHCLREVVCSLSHSLSHTECTQDTLTLTHTQYLLPKVWTPTRVHDYEHKRGGKASICWMRR